MGHHGLDSREEPHLSLVRPYVPRHTAPADDSEPPAVLHPPSLPKLAATSVPTADLLLEIEAQVIASDLGGSVGEKSVAVDRDLLVLCGSPISVAEIAATLDVGVGIARQRVGNAVQDGYLDVMRPRPETARAPETLERTIRGLTLFRGLGHRAATVPTPVKILITGGSGVGKTTLLDSISERRPLTTEMTMPAIATGDKNDATTEISSVTVETGRITMADGLRLYFFSTASEAPFGFMSRDLSHGALGALVVADRRRLAESFPAIDYFETIALPYVIAVNRFAGTVDPAKIRDALAVGDDVPVITFDARERCAVRDTLLTVLRHSRNRPAHADSTVGR